MKKKRKVTTYIEHLYCDKCMVEMKRISTTNTTIGISVSYKYKCPCCDETVTLNERYPKAITEVEND